MLRYLYQSHKIKIFWSTEENTRKLNFLRNKSLVHSALMTEAVVAGGSHWLLSREAFRKHLVLLHNPFLITGMAEMVNAITTTKKITRLRSHRSYAFQSPKGTQTSNQGAEGRKQSMMCYIRVTASSGAQ